MKTKTWGKLISMRIPASATRTFTMAAALLALHPAASRAETEINSANLAFDRIEGSIVHFKTGSDGNPKPLKTPYTDIKFLKIMSPPKGGRPWVLLSARPNPNDCRNCEQDTAIWLVHSEGGGKPMRFVYPGRVLDPKTKNTLIESRAFYGRCVPAQDYPGETWVVFQRERVDRRGSLQPSVFIAEVGTKMVHEKLMENRLPKLATTLGFVKAKTCFELAGRNRLMLTKPLDLTPRKGGETEEGDDDAARDAAEDETPGDTPKSTGGGAG